MKANLASAIIVLYYPNIEKLKDLYLSLLNQVSHIIFIDNTPNIESCKDNEIWIKNLRNPKCHYLCLNGNKGIATAQNIGIDYAKKLNSDFVLLLDQDSVLPNDMVKDLLYSYQKLTQVDKKVAVIAPIFLDEKTQKISPLVIYKMFRAFRFLPDKNAEYENPDYVISSGSLINLDVLEMIGNMQEELFIDWVDIEWGLRAKQLGYKSYAIPSVVMKHNIGDESVDVGRSINLHSDFRNYFIVRNSVYLALYSKLPINFRVMQFFKMPLYVIFYSYYSKKPFYSLKLLMIAIKDGLSKNMGKGYFDEKGSY